MNSEPIFLNTSNFYHIEKYGLLKLFQINQLNNHDLNYNLNEVNVLENGVFENFILTNSDKFFKNEIFCNLKENYSSAFINGAILTNNEEEHEVKALIKLIGDGTLSSFESAVKAVECAIKIIKYIDKKCEFKIRIGIHLGEIIYKNNDVFGDGVNIASRLENLAEPGTILISKDVNDQLVNHLDIKTDSLGKHSIKGIGRIIEIFNANDQR